MHATRHSRTPPPRGWLAVRDAAVTAEQPDGAVWNNRMSASRTLIDALEALASAIVEATGSSAFLASERIQLIDAAHKAAWLLVRVNRNESAIARHPELGETTRAVVATMHHLHSIRRLGEGSEALDGLLALLVRIDGLLPGDVRIYQE